MKGLGTALITPFNKDLTVDYDALDHLLDLQLASAVDYIVALGTTGEPATLTPTERHEVLHHLITRVNGRKPIILGLGGNCTAAVIAELQSLDTTGISAILSVCPYYNKPSQEGLYQHFVAIAKASPLPIIIYNVPGRAGVNLLPETAFRIYEAVPDRIMGIKEASGNMEQMQQLISLSRGTDFHVICGDDGLAYQSISSGAAGLISVISNAWPDQYAKLIHENKAYIQAAFEEMINLIFREGSPAGIKTVLSHMHIIQNTLRLPLVPCSPDLQTEIEQEMQNIH